VAEGKKGMKYLSHFITSCNVASVIGIFQRQW